MDGADEEAGGGEMKKNAWVWLAVAGLAVQAAGLGWLVARYERLVTRGTEVRVPCEAFDPKDVLRGRYLHVKAEVTCEELGELSPYNWDFREEKKFHALLVPTGDGVASHRVARVAKEPGEEGLWVKALQVRWSWDSEERRWNPPLRVRFPGKLFLDERLAGKADKVFAEKREGAEAEAVYRAWKGEMAIVDVEIDGVSVKALARGASASEK